MKRFFRKLSTALGSAALFFTISIILFGIIKATYLLLKKDLFISKYTIAGTIFIFIILGIIYGIKSASKKNKYSKTISINKINFLMTLFVSITFTLGAYLIISEGFKTYISLKTLIGIFIILTVLMYPFCAIFSLIISQKKTAKKNYVFLILFNPLFIVMFFLIFTTLIYNSIYVPCGVIIKGIEENKNTINTKNLEIKSGEILQKIDDKEIKSISEVKKYLENIETTKEIQIETEKNIYYIKTYEENNNKKTGLILSQAYCERKY
ncbi:MAG: hypothetical protein QXK76_01585 [Candidatus Woesearchaeota archaeon]